MVTPVMAGVCVSGVFFGACDVKFIRSKIEGKVTSLAFDVFASMAVVAVAVIQFQISIIPNIALLAMASTCLLVLMQAVDILMPPKVVKGEKV